MEDGGDRSPLDGLVDGALGLLGKLGFNTTRLRWRWNRYREQLRQRRRDAENRMRGLTGRHRMCPSCRALVPSGSRACSECGASLAGGSGPGPARLLQWIMPGIPRVSALIVSANFLIFILMAMRAGFAPASGGLFNIMSFSGETLYRYGAGSDLLLRATGSLSFFLREDWWRLVTPTFLHHGLIHLLFNMFLLVQLGPLLEEEQGGDRFFVLYVASGTGGWVASEILRYYLFGGGVLTVGASGAVLGLVGAVLVLGARRGGAYGGALRASMTRFLVLMVIMSIFMWNMMDHFAHIGGLATGAAFAALVPERSTARDSQPALWRMASLACMLLVAVSLLFAGWKGLVELERFR